MQNKTYFSECDYQKTIEFMFSCFPMYQRVGKAAYKANLDNIKFLCNYLGNPQNNLKFIHVAGTNGKTSVSHYLASIFHKAGYNTGLYTSPHILDFRERISINNVLIDKKYICDFVNKHKNYFLECKPSFFEISCALAFQYFYDNGVDYAIIEVGLGGRLDSTNIINPFLSIITNIGFDHTEFLGNTLEAIAAEKAGIIKPYVPVIISETQQETKDVFINKATNNNAPIFFADQLIHLIDEKQKIDSLSVYYNSDYSHLDYHITSNLVGRYEIKNMKAVLLATEIINNIPKQAVLQGFNSTTLRGRWDIINVKPYAICDTGHNFEGIKESFEMLKFCDYNKLHVVFGVVNDKKPENTLKILPKDAVYYLCKPSVERGMDVNVLSSIFTKENFTIEVFNSCKDAYLAALNNATSSDLIYIGGSTFVVADVMAYQYMH